MQRGFGKRIRDEIHGAHALFPWFRNLARRCELFVSQGKYANNMESSKPMETPLAGNWRKEDATSGEVVEAIIYKQLVGSIMYLVNTRLDMCLTVN